MAEVQQCPHCDANNPPDAVNCWLCHRHLDGPVRDESEKPMAGGARYAPLAKESTQLSFSLGSLMLVMTLIAVLCGMFAVAPGIGVLLAIASLPVLIRTAGVVRSRKEAGLPTSPAKRILLFIGSLLATLVTAVVVCVASIGTFCGLCLGIGSLDNFSESSVAAGYLVAIPAAIAVTIGMILLARKWAKARWQRDTQEV
jgi:hypothetical protein